LDLISIEKSEKMSSDVANDPVQKNDKPAASTSVPRKRSRKRGRDTNAPVQPANSYTRFMMARRPQLVQEHPELSHVDISKRIGEEWKSLSAEEKEIYTTKAMADRMEYMKELQAYKKTDSYKLFRKKMKKNIDSTSHDQIPDDLNADVPIFSKEFLELNRQRESELRRLRIESVRLEEEQVALENFISRLKKATEELETDVRQQRDLADKIRSQLDNYRRSLVQAFAHMPLPGTNIVPTSVTIDSYMNNIHKLVLETPGEHQDFVAKVRDIVTKLKIPLPPL